MLVNTQTLCLKHANCTFLNYITWDNKKLGDHPDELFYDYVHLNQKGADAFSKIVNADIESAIGNKKYE